MAKIRKWQLVGLVFLSLVGVFFELAMMASLASLIAALVGGSNAFANPLVSNFEMLFDASRFSSQAWLALVILFCTLGVLARLVVAWGFQFYTFGIGRDLSVYIFEKLVSLNYLQLKSGTSSDAIATILAKVNTVCVAVVAPSIRLAVNVVTIAVFISYFYSQAPSLVLLSLFSICTFYLAVALALKAKVSRYANITDQSKSKVVLLIQDLYGCVAELKVYAKSSWISQIFTQVSRDLYDAQSRVQFYSNFPRIVLEWWLIVLIGIFLMSYELGAGGHGIFNLPLIAAAGYAVLRLLPLGQQVYASLMQIKGNRAEWAQVMSYLDEPFDSFQLVKERNLLTPPCPSDVEDLALKLSNISFRYRGLIDATIYDVDFCIRSDQIVGVIGPSGSGKSTLAKIICGLIAPSSGDIEVCTQGSNYSKCDAQYLSQISAYVPQEVHLLNESIENNIAFGCKDIDSALVAECAARACIYDDIVAMKDGFMTLVGEGGANLSGGQRQRIGIARALYKTDAKILVLDECTSALDPETEYKVVKSLKDTCKGMAVVMIAHRYDALRFTSEVIELSGRVTWHGSYEELGLIAAFEASEK